MDVSFSETEILAEVGHNGHMADVREVLEGAVREVLGEAAASDADHRVVRVVVPMAGARPLDWLRAQIGAPRIYWHGRGTGGASIAGFGVADEIVGDGLEVLEQLHWYRGEPAHAGLHDVRYYGGCGFDLDAPREAPWTAFPRLWFFLPRLELHASAAETRLICNLLLPRDSRDPAPVFEAIAHLRECVSPREAQLKAPIMRRDVPDRAGWERAIEAALGLLDRHLLDKIVVARKAVFSFAEDVDPCLLLEQLEAVTPACFHFLVERTAGSAFVGASPERLYRRDGRAIESEAVAGTRPRGKSEDDDRRLRDELLLSDKDRREHQYVERSIREVLQDLTEQLDVDADTSEMTLARGRHLVSGVHGVLRQEVEDLDVLRALHPTPAVGGYPTSAALPAIRRIEDFDRGWYAGPVGWMSRAAAEFAVGIRTGLVSGRNLTLFSGAGIVTGSEAQAEWEEIEHKIGDFTNVLGLDLRRAKY